MQGTITATYSLWKRIGSKPPCLHVCGDGLEACIVGCSCSTHGHGHHHHASYLQSPMCANLWCLSYPFSHTCGCPLLVLPLCTVLQGRIPGTQSVRAAATASCPRGSVRAACLWAGCPPWQRHDHSYDRLVLLGCIPPGNTNTPICSDTPIQATNYAETSPLALWYFPPGNMNIRIANRLVLCPSVTQLAAVSVEHSYM